MNIIKFIKEKHKQAKIKRDAENRRQFYEIRGAVIKFYEDKQAADGNIDLPAFVRADNILKEIIKTPADIRRYYKKLLKYKAVA